MHQFPIEFKSCQDFVFFEIFFHLEKKSEKFSEHLWVQMWCWDELEDPMHRFGAKIISDPRFRISHQTSVVCCCVQVTECVCKWETICSKRFSVFFRKTIHFRVSSPGWGNKTYPIQFKINPSLVQVSQFRIALLPITGGISETRSESSSRSLPQQQ